MQNVQIDELVAMISQPAGRTQETSIRDHDGSLIGFFVPASEYQRRKYADCPLTTDEIERRKKETNGRSLDEILADWERLK